MILDNLEIHLVDLVCATRDHVSVLKIVGADEFGIHLDDANKNYGYSSKGLKIRQPGNYAWGISS